jgi:hypothetical protein
MFDYPNNQIALPRILASSMPVAKAGAMMIMAA